MGKKLNNYLESSEAAATPSTVFETVSLSSDSVFQRAVSILHTSYLDSASEHGFQYSQVTLVKNDIFLNEYKTFYQQKKASNYTQEELQETYGFLLFETENQAKLVCQRGLCVGSSTVTTLGDPAKGVYISRYSDYLHPRPWYHGKSGYVVIFNLIKGKVKFVPENYTTNYTGPSSGYDCHVATNINRVSPKTSHFRAFELSQYYVYELSDNTVIERPRQVCPSIIVAFQYKEPKTMATPKSILELHENVLISPWKGKLIIQGCLLCDITLCSTYGTVIPRQLPLELDFKYVIKVSSLKKRLPEDAFKKPSYLEPKVCHQDICSNLYEVELSNKQGEKVDKLTEYIKNEELAIVKCLEDRGVFILLTSSSLISDTGFESEQASLHGLHLFHSPLSAGMKDLKVEDGISSKVTPILPILNCALMEAKKSFTEEGIRPNTLIKQNFQELYKGYRSPSLTADSQDGTKEMAFFGQVSNGFDSVSPAEKCPMQSLTQLQSYFSDPSGYILEVSTALDLLAEHPESPCVSDGICDAGFSLVMTPDPEFLDSESEVRKETETEKNPEEILKSGKRSMIPLSAAANLRVQPKRKATMPLMIQNKRINLCRPFPKRTAATNSGSDSTLTLKLAKGQFPQKRKRAKGETASQLQSEILPDSQENAVSISTAPSENTVVDQKDFRENSVAHCDSQALNMLADLALSSATSSTPSTEPRNFPCTAEFSQNDVLLSEENSVPGASDHEYHRGIKSQKGELLPKLSTDRKTNSVADLTGTEDEDSLVPCSQAPFKAQSTLIEDTRETSDVSHSSCVAVEHSYALLLAEHSNRRLQQRGLQGPAFAKNGTKGPEAGTPVGKVMPFRHQQNISPLQKVFDPFVKRKNRLMSSSLKDFYCSHTVFSCDGSFKVTFKCEPEYVFSLDSKYTNNPLEKTVVRALHGPWNTDLPDNVEEVKLLLHMWVALFYSNQNKVIRSTRKVVEHSNPAKFVSINSTIDSFELNEIEESCSMERCSPDPLLENKETSRGQATEMSFPDTDALLPVIKLPPARALDLCVQNEQKEVFVGEGYHDNSGSQNFIWSCNNKVIERKAEQEESDQLETCSAVLSSNGSIQTNGPSMPDEDQTFQPLNSTKMTSHNDAVTQTAFTKACDGINSQSVTCENPVYDTLESKDGVFPATMQGKTEIVQDLNQHVSPINKECQPSLESKDDNMGYVMINLEPVALTFEKNTCVPIQTEVVNRSDKPTTFNMELIKQVSPDISLSQPVSEFEKAQTQGLHDISTLAASEPKGNEYLCASSVSRKTLAKEICSLQEDSPLPVSLSSSDNSVVKEVVSLVKNSSYPLPSEEMQLSQDSFLQTQNPFTVTLGDAVEPTRFEEEVSSSASATLERNYPLNCISPKRIISDDSVELRKNDNSCLNSESVSFESFNSAFTKHTSLSMNREEVSLELSEEDSDIDLTLTISPPTSPREQIPADEIEQLQEDPLSSLEFQDVTEEIIESGEVTVMGDREVNSAAYVSLSEEPLEDKERKGDDFQPVTVVLSKDSSTFEISGKVNVTSDFPFGSLIEEVSPASSPDPLVPAEEIQPSPAIFPCSLNLHDVQCKKNNVSSQIESVDFAVTEKENSFVGPSHPFGQDDLTQVQGIQHYAEMPLLLSGHQEGKDKHLTFCGKVTEEIVQSEHDRVLSFPEKQQCCDAELNQPAAATLHEHDSKPSLGKLVKPESPLQSGNIENRNVNTEHLTLETSEPPFNPRKIIESESSAGVFVSTAASDGIVSVPLKQPTSPKSIKKNVFSNDLKTNEGTYLQVKSLNSGSVDGAVITQAYTPSEIPKLGPSDSVTSAINVETEYQRQEISVVRMASLLKDSETKAELNKETIDVSLQSDMSQKGEQTIPMLQDTSVCETKDLSNGGFLPICTDCNQITPDTSEKKELPASFVPNSFDSLICEASKEYMDNKSARERLPARDGSETLDRDLDVSVKPDVHYEPLSDNSDRDSLGDYRNPKLDMEDSCTLRCSHNRKREDATKDDYNSFTSVNNSDSEDWDYSKEPPELETSMPPRSQSSGLKKEDKCMPRFIQIKDLHGIPRVYTNFTVTREFKETTITLPRLRRHPSFTEKCGLISSWTRTWQIADDLTQNTLDLEYLRFAHKLKQLVKSRGSQHFASSTSAFPKESPIQIAVGAVPFTELSESSVLHPASRSRSPLLVTVVHSDPRQPSPHMTHMRSHVPSSLDSSFFWKEKCSHNRHHLPDSEGSQTASFHLNKLQYTGTLNESRNDISLILNEYAAFNKVMNGNQEVFQGKELSVASGEATSQEIHSSLQRKPVSYEDMITDLCANLHVKLKSVMKEACKRTFFFYLVETEDKSFFLRTKNILRKGGHTEMEPQHFLKAFHRERDILIVILRNEDIASHLHQIPSLLKLKHLPSVVFAGIDSPEDVLDCTYQELFRTGGFVVSDDKILETLTLVQLKEIVKILENLNGNGNGKWKWLLHYRENKKLKEDIRVDSVAHKKNLVMKSCQSADIIELLHYHYCDSPSSTKAEHLKCLLNLQIQRIDARFAVFLTDKLTVARDVIENSGILVTDVNNFIDNIQKVAAPFRSSYW